MRALPLLLLVALASGASAQTDARLYGAWTLSPDAPPPKLADEELELEYVWIEFGTDGRTVGWSTVVESGHRLEMVNATTYRVENGVIYGAEGAPGRVEFLAGGDIRITDGDMSLILRRVSAPVLGLDVLGSWRAIGERAQTVTFSADEGDAARVTFDVGESAQVGTWHVDASGLTVDTPGMGTVTYTGITRDGDRITLTGDGESLMLEPPATQ